MSRNSGGASAQSGSFEQFQERVQKSIAKQVRGFLEPIFTKEKLSQIFIRSSGKGLELRSTLWAGDESFVKKIIARHEMSRNGYLGYNDALNINMFLGYILSNEKSREEFKRNPEEFLKKITHGSGLLELISKYKEILQDLLSGSVEFSTRKPDACSYASASIMPTEQRYLSFVMSTVLSLTLMQ